MTLPRSSRSDMLSAWARAHFPNDQTSSPKTPRAKLRGSTTAAGAARIA